MPARDGKMGSYNLCREEGSMGFLFTSHHRVLWWHRELRLSILHAWVSFGQTLIFSSEAHAFLFAVITPAWPKGERKKWLVGSFLFGCFCGVTLNNPGYRGGSTHTYKKAKQNSKWHKKDNSPVFGSVDFLQLWIAAQQLGFYGGSLGWRKRLR